MSDKNTVWSVLLVVAMVLFSSSALAANGFNYMSNIDPHTRFNPQLNGCYYYYGYGSCTVAKTNCNGVPVGRDKQLDLGDACKRNAPPKLSSTNTSENVVLMENGKAVVYINKLSNIQVVEGQKVVL
jgi:hypothetical protein